MKRSWIVRMDEKAVSPVIATILMVAITVVLAAVLYVMVTGLIGGGASSPPAMSLGVPSPTGTSYQIKVDSVDRVVTLASYTVQLQNLSASGANMCGSTPVTLAAGNVCTSGGMTLSYTDTNGDGKFSGGDYFTLSQVGTGMSYKFFLFWKTSGNEILDKTIG